MDTQLAALFEALRGTGSSDALKREDVDELATITGMSMKASRKLLRKYRGNKDDALMAWFDKDVDSAALEAASDSETEDEADVTERVRLTSDWPLFPTVVEWIQTTSGTTIDLRHVSKPKDHTRYLLSASKPGDVVPDVQHVRVPQGKKAATPEDEEKEIFAGLSIGQPVRVRRYCKEMRQSRAGWKEDTEFDQKRLCGRVGIVRAVTRRDLTARIEFTGYGSGWWDIRWLEPLPAPLHIESACGCTGYAVFKGDRKQVKLALRCLAQITTYVRVGGFGVFLAPIRKAVEHVVPLARGEVMWRSLLRPDGEIVGYQLCITDPRVVGPVARCIEGELTWNIDRNAAVSEEVVTRVAKLARTKTGCVVVSAPKGDTKMDAGALVIRNPRCWVGGNADGLEGARVAPGVVLGCDAGRAQVFWLNSSAVATHRWGFDDTFDLVLMPCFAPVGRLLVVLVGIDRIPGLTWEMLIRVVREALTMEGAELVRTVLTKPQWHWNGDTFTEKINTLALARALTEVVVSGWASDGVLPPPLVSDQLHALGEAFQMQNEPIGGHLGIWREAKVTVHQFYCSTPSRREGPVCQHPGGAIQAPHWGCCGQQAKSGTCRQTESRVTPLHPQHPLRDRTMSIMSWVCDRCKCRAEPQQGQRWRCDTCDYDLCDPCFHDSLRAVKKTHVQLAPKTCSQLRFITVLGQKVDCALSDGCFTVSVNRGQPRRITSIAFSLGEDGAQPVVTFSDTVQHRPVEKNGPVHGYTVGQPIHAAKDIYVQVSVAVQQGGHGTVIGPSTSGDPRRVCVKFLGREAKINVMPAEVRPILAAPRRARVVSSSGRGPLRLLREKTARSASAGDDPTLPEVASGSEVLVTKDDGDGWLIVDSDSGSGYVRHHSVRELNTQATVAKLSTRGLADVMSSLKSLAEQAGAQCDIPGAFDLTVGGKLPTVVVSGLAGESAGMNGVYRRAPAEDDCRVIYRKGDSTLYFRGSWWKLNNNTRHDGWLQSSRALVGQWSVANSHDARTDAPYPKVSIGETGMHAIPAYTKPLPTVLPLTSTSMVLYDVDTAALSLRIAEGSAESVHAIQSMAFASETTTLTLAPVAVQLLLSHEMLVENLSALQALAEKCGIACTFPPQVEVVTGVDYPAAKHPPLTMEILTALTKAAMEAPGGDGVRTIAGKHGWANGGFAAPLTESHIATMARQIHELIGDKMTADISLDVVAQKTTSVAVVGPQPGRQRAKGFLGKLRDLQEVAIRVPSENHAVVERHRADIQKHVHTHMNVGFGGAVVRLTGTSSAIRHTRRAIATLLMKHWREQQRQRREVVLEQVVASAMEVRVKKPLTAAMKELLDRKENPSDGKKRHDESEAERRLDEARLVSMTQEISREYERLANSCRSQLATTLGMTNVALCKDEFTRGDRVVRGPTWQWGDQDGGAGSTGTVLGGHDEDGWVVVEWDKSGRLARHRSGPLFQDLKHVQEQKLPTFADEATESLDKVIKSRVATHTSRSLDFLQQISVCKFNWAEEEHRHKGIVHEARIGVKEMEAAEKFQGWLRDLFGVKERAAREVAALNDMIENDRRDVLETLDMVTRFESEHSLPQLVMEPVASGELSICLVLEHQVHGQGNTPFDVCGRRSVQRSSRLRVKSDATVAQCYTAVEQHLGSPQERIRLWYFAPQPNGTFRPAFALRRSDQVLSSVCQPGPHMAGEVQLLVETLSDVPDVPSAPSKEVTKWRVLQQDGFPGAPFRPSKEASSTQDIPNGAEVEVLEEDGEWVKVVWDGAKGFVRRRNVTKEAVGQGILFLKFFDYRKATLVRYGFRVVNVAEVCLADLFEPTRTEFHLPTSAPLDVYVEETPELLRRIAAANHTLEALGVKSGAVLIFQEPPPATLLRPLKLGDTVIHAGPVARAGCLAKGSKGKVTGINVAQSQIKVVGPQGETEVFSDRALCLDPLVLGFEFPFATAAAFFAHYIQGGGLPPLECSEQHPMVRIDNARRYVCSYCQAPGEVLAFWGCKLCEHYLCLLCANESRRAATTSQEDAAQLSPRAQPAAMRFLRTGKITELLAEHNDRVERMFSSLQKHNKLLDGTVSEVLMHVRRLGEQRQHRRLFGWDLLLHLMDTTGCLLELQEEHLLVIGRPLAVKKAIGIVDEMQTQWPPSALPTEAKVEVSPAAVDRLFGTAGVLAKGLQFECGLQDVQPIDDTWVWLRGRQEHIIHARERLELILDLPPGSLELRWAETLSPETSPTHAQRCPVCLDDLTQEEEDVITFACNHSVHRDCGGQYLLAHGKSKDSIKCLEADCSYVLRVDEYAALAQGIDGLMKPSEYYDNLIREALLRHDKVVACPFGGCNGWAVAGNVVGTVENLHCFECDRLFCPICRKQGHFFSQCEEVAEAAKIRAGGAAKQQLEEEEQSRKAIAELCRPCPRCGAQVSRTEGCPHITCKVCKFEFCYDCLRAIPHFGECDKAKLADRMRRVRAEHGGVIYHKYTRCDICGKHPIPDSEEAYTCLNCLHWSICGTCEAAGKTCGYEGHILSVLPRSDEPPAEAVVKGEKQKWRLKLNEVPYYEIDWDVVKNRQTPLSASSAAAGEGGAMQFERQVSNRCRGRVLNLSTPLTTNQDWGNATRNSSLLGMSQGLKELDPSAFGGSTTRADTVLFEWEESDFDTESDSSLPNQAQEEEDDEDDEFNQAAFEGQPDEPDSDSTDTDAEAGDDDA
eukprot:TRINITY_DN11601_c0_g1_i1.p1 TRINITY_DN11601_c0_g1~~TRINITY_DN11601_c0_g1_i1.p1  ORF type:complete len:2693 (+),score=956.95 TRINITY_DN11601_c0_g1_i1:82-8160(+)